MPIPSELSNRHDWLIGSDNVQRGGGKIGLFCKSVKLVQGGSVCQEPTQYSFVILIKTNILNGNT